METVVKQVTEPIEEEENCDIFRVSKSRIFSNLWDKDDPTYVVSALETCYSDNEAVVGPLYFTDYESEEEEGETLPNISPSASDRNLWTRKDVTFWSSFSSLEGRFRSHNIIRTKLQTFQSSEICTPKDAFQYFLTHNIIEKYCCNKLAKWTGF